MHGYDDVISHKMVVTKSLRLRPELQGERTARSGTVRAPADSFASLDLRTTYVQSYLNLLNFAGRV